MTDIAAPPRSGVRALRPQRTTWQGVALFLGLVVTGAFTVDGFLTTANVKSMLLLAAFLGLASVGQTLCALAGGVDLSIPFVIGSANISLLYLTAHGVPSGPAVLVVLAAGLVIGAVNGLLSVLIPAQSLVVTLGVGFAVVGAAQIMTSIGSEYGGVVVGTVPTWLTNLSSLNGTTLGVALPPVVLVWAVISVILLVVLARTWFGRGLYALGGNRTAAELMLVSTRRKWMAAFGLSGLFSAGTGIVLLGFTGGGFVGIGDPYLFTTIAAVAVGGTSLLGGRGGYGSTILGTLVLTLLTTLLVGYGLSPYSQQALLGLLIIGIVATYSRRPRLRHQI